MQTGIELIAAERERQITAEGWSAAHDDWHTNRELVDASVAYLFADDGDPIKSHPGVWPWDDESWKPSENPLRNLAKAGALIAAEMDRLMRLDSQNVPALPTASTNL